MQNRQLGLREAGKGHRKAARGFWAIWLGFCLLSSAGWTRDDCADYLREYKAFRTEFVMPPSGNWLERLWNKVTFRETRLRRQEAHKRNKEVLAELNAEPMTTPTGRKGSLSPEEIRALLASVSSHPVASFSRLREYDPEGAIGFCFGRAMTAHLEALWHYGLASGAVKKIWAVGPIRGLSVSWQYHVTTAVRGNDGKWYTVDPLFGQPLTVDEWYTRMRGGLSFTSDMLLFASDAGRLYPSGPGTYGVLPTGGDGYKKYYDDVLEGYRREFRDKLTARRTTAPVR